MSDWEIVQADCREHLKTLAENSVDSVVTDPPAGINFMVQSWDDHGDRAGFVSFLTGVMRECLRVLKPGGYAVVWSLPRTSHWTTWAMEDAGFEIRDVGLGAGNRIHHVFGQGFPKSHAVGRAIDKSAGAERPVIGRNPNYRDSELAKQVQARWNDAVLSPNRTGPATEAAAEWEGWGTALKPAVEYWIVARKPLEGTVVENVLKWGTGALNIDATRVGFADAVDETEAKTKNRHADFGSAPRENRVYGKDTRPPGIDGNWDPVGRWPANLVLVHLGGCRRSGEVATVPGRHYPNESIGGYGTGIGASTGGSRRSDGPDVSLGPEAVEQWECVEGCPVAELDQQSGVTRTGDFKQTGQSANTEQLSGWRTGNRDPATYRGDEGGASRFFPTFSWEEELALVYTPKASRGEREAGLTDLPDELFGRGKSVQYAIDAGETEERYGKQHGYNQISRVRNTHPTTKPIALMRFLCRLVTPVGGRILDPFAGSGTTGCAAAIEGFDFLGIEQNPQYCEIARARIAHWEKAPPVEVPQIPALERNTESLPSLQDWD